MIQEKAKSAPSGWLALAILLPLFVGSAYFMVKAFERDPWAGFGWMLLLIAAGVCLGGLFVVNPNQGLVLQLFGDYAYTAKNPGLRWANPFYSKRRISLRVRNFESEKLKVNDSDGNPVEIAAVIVWKVVDTAQASFEVDDYENYVRVQSEAAVRNLATRYPYDAHDDSQTSLRSNAPAVSDHLNSQIH